MAKIFYFEDFETGQQFSSREIQLDKEQTIKFASEYDPQYFHMDEAAATKGVWGQLVASGWHTAAISMRLKLDTPLADIAGGLVGLGIESLKWPRPVYPNDALKIVVTVMDKRLSSSKPAYGIMKYKVETLNQKQEVVMEMTTAVLVPRRDSKAA